MSKTKIETRKSKTADPYMIDETAYRYLAALEHPEVLKKALLAMCRECGFTPKDAPKTKMLAGEFYEVLASRATRTVVDQKAALRLKHRMCLEPAAFKRLLAQRVVFSLQEKATRYVQQLPAHMRRAFERAVYSKGAGTRLTVRKKKIARGSAPRRKAA